MTIPTRTVAIGRDATGLHALTAVCGPAGCDLGAAQWVVPRDALDDRALFGSAFCRARSGDRGGARAELQRYLAIFPEGRFAAEARRALVQP